MRKINLFKISVIFTFIVAMSSCNSSKEETTTKDDTKEKSPVETVLSASKVPFLAKGFAAMIKPELFQFNSLNNFVFTTRKGMKITIPKGVLLDANNQVVKGDVSIEVKEYYTAGEIILSQLPMHYMENGKINHFESDGMFTITATQKNEPLHIAEGKEIVVETKRTKEGQGFEFYQLDENDKWVKDQKNEVTLVQAMTKTAVVARPTRPVQVNIVKFNSNYYTIESDDRAYLPEVSEVNSGDYVRQLDIDVKENPWILDRSKWKYARNYGEILIRKEGKKESYDTIPYTVLNAVRGNKKYTQLKEENELALAQYENEFEAYEKNLLARRDAGEISNKELVQELVIGKFGTYNIDRYYAQNSSLIVEKRFDVSSPIQIQKGYKIYLLVKDDGQLIAVDLTIYPEILRFNKKEKNALIAMTNEKIYSLTKKQFEEIVQTQAKAPEFEFEMDELIFTDVIGFNETIETLF
jgi:hypothetical protein